MKPKMLKLLRPLWLWSIVLCGLFGTSQLANATTLYAIRSSTELIRFDSATPESVTNIGIVSGLQPGEAMVGMDYSPFTGGVYVLSSSSRLYSLDVRTAAASAISAAPFVPALTGLSHGFDCEPNSGLARIIRSTGNQTVDLATGATQSTDTAPGDSIRGFAYASGGAAPNAFGIDYTNDILRSYTTPSNGVGTPVGSLGVVGQGSVFGFDIASNGRAYLSYRVGTPPSYNLYMVSLSTGAATLQGLIGDGATEISALTSVPGADIARPGVITIRDNNTASPYPSQLVVENLPNIPISRVRVSLHNISHNFADDIRILLVGPSGQKSLLMANTGGNSDLVNSELTFADDAPALPDSGLISSGEYAPTAFTDGTTVNFPAPAPIAPYTTPLSVFNGTDPNGVWSLYVYDDAGGDSGQIADGWSLDIEQTPSTYTFSTNQYTLSESAGFANLTINRTGNLSGASSVAYSVRNGSTSNEVQLVNSSVLFADGQSSATLSLSIFDDVFDEFDEAFTVQLSPSTTGFSSLIGVSPGDAPFVPGNASVILTDNDAPPQISTPNFLMTEGAAGTNAVATFSAILDKVSQTPVTFSYAIAAAGNDIINASGTVTIPPGSILGTFTVFAVGDNFTETDEVFTVTLSNAVGATLPANGPTLTLINDDAAIALTSFSPAAALPGATVVLTGTNFGGASTVTFNGVAANFTVNSATQITAIVPAGATTGTISVTALGGTATSATNFGVPPVIGNVFPNQGASGAVSVLVGARLENTTSVTINNLPVPFVKQGPTQLRFTVPANASTGLIRVTTPGGTATTNSPYLVLPTLTGVTPNRAVVNSNIVLTGTAFVNVQKVLFGIVPATFTVNSPTRITARVPVNAPNASITVITASGRSLNRVLFTVLPRLTTFTPASGAVGTTVLINGTNFVGVRQVFFGTRLATFRQLSATQIRAIVPTGAVTARIRIVTIYGEATTTANFVVPPVAPQFSAPRLSSAMFNAASQTVRLNFIGSVPAGAGEPETYNVSVDGVPVETEGVRFGGSSVLLFLGEGVLKPDSRVEVQAFGTTYGPIVNAP